MKRIRGIIESTTEPITTDCIWIKGNEARYFINGEWVYIGESSEGREELEKKVDELDKEVGSMSTKVDQSFKSVNSFTTDSSVKLSYRTNSNVTKDVYINSASANYAGLMTAYDRAVLGNTASIDITNFADHPIDQYTTTGTYRIYGQRKNANDGLPILNSNPGHTVEGILKVLNSSISGSGQDTDKVVTQVLTMSNRTGADGHTWIRTGQGDSEANLTWSTWEKMQGIFEKNNVTTLKDLDGYTTNGMYSGIYAGTEPKNFYTVQFLPLDTFLMITINGYAVSKLAVPQITQLLYKLPAKTSTSKQNAEIYLRTGSYNKTDKVWVWDTFTKMVTNADLSAQVKTLTDNINQKQDALTLTVKDNGNIVLANIQGQSKEFMPATPSGDPMHYAYVDAGAEYNDTGVDIVRTTPWADMIDDDYNGEYGKTVVHKAGYWYFNGLGDISNAEMNNILLLKYWYCIASKESIITDTCRVLFPCSNRIMDFSYSFTNSSIVILPYNSINFIGSGEGIFYYATELVHIISKSYIDFSRLPKLTGSFSGCTKLMTFKLKNLKLNINLSITSYLSVKSVLYMINNEAATSPITITLHADVYNRCMANEDILAALESHTNISLASA